jgi:LCP family protein required for cell wall assembly
MPPPRPPAGRPRDHQRAQMMPLPGRGQSPYDERTRPMGNREQDYAPPQPPPRQPPPRPEDDYPPSRPPRRRRWGFGRILMTLLLVFVVFLAGVWVYLEFSIKRVDALADYDGRPVAAAGTNWLIVGSDSRQDLTAEQQQELATGGDIGSSRTDTILLVHMPEFRSSTPTTMVSIPRDSFVPIPGHGKDKINAAFAIGGAPLLAQTVERATGLRLDHYAEIGFGGFAGLVDTLGGVTVCPTAPINDPLAGIDLPAGCQKLSGREALGYVRSRDTPRADLDRMANQRQFLSALLHRAASPAVWLDPRRWYSVPRAAAGAMTVDRGDHVWDLARLGWALHGSTTALTVPIGEFTNGDAGAVVVWNHDAAGKLFEALASDAPVPAAALEGQQ